MSERRERFHIEGEAALKPTGSFSLGGVRREPSEGVGERGGQRFASLGGGRAKVPLMTVRSASQGAGGRVATDSRPASPSPTAPGAATPPANPAPVSNSPTLTTQLSRAASVSSLAVETGSLASDVGAVSEDFVETPTTAIAPSPLSSPMVGAAPAIDLVTPVDLDSSTQSLSALRQPPGSLLAHQRQNSALSVSSMLVETGSSASEDGEKVGAVGTPEVETPTGLEGKTFEVETYDSTVNAEAGAGLGMSVEQDDGDRERKEEEQERRMVAATNEELKQYESEKIDATAPRANQSADVPSASAKSLIAVFQTYSTEDSPPLIPSTLVVSRSQNSQGSHHDESDIGETSVNDHQGDSSVDVFETPRIGSGTLTPKSETTFESVEEVLKESEEEEGSGYGDYLEDYASLPSPRQAVNEERKTLVRCSDCAAEIDLAVLGDHDCSPRPLSTLTLALTTPQLGSSTQPHTPPKSLNATDPSRSTSQNLLDSIPSTTAMEMPEDVDDDQDDPLADYLDSRSSVELDIPQDVVVDSLKRRGGERGDARGRGQFAEDEDDEKSADGWATVVRHS